MADIIDSGPLAQEGGAKKKDVVLYAGDDGGAGGLGTLFPEPNAYLADYNVGFRKFKAADVIAPTPAEGGEAGWIKADPAAPRQRAVWIKAEVLPPNTLGHGSWPISDGVPLKIDVAQIKAWADWFAVDRTKLLKHTVAHEFGHVFQLDHDKGERIFVWSQPAAANLSDYWPASSDQSLKTIDYWIPVGVKDVGVFTRWAELDILTDVEPAGANVIVQYQSSIVRDSLQAAGITVNVHAVAHRTGIPRVVFQDPVATSMKLKLDVHQGHLMDPAPDPNELDGAQANLKAADKTRIKVR